MRRFHGLMACITAAVLCFGYEFKFEDVSDRAGVRFTHFNGMTGGHYLPEIVGSGCALFDMDNDGDLDLYLVQGAVIDPNKTIADALIQWTAKDLPQDRLFRNDGLDKNGVPQFIDVTELAGLQMTGIGMGVATGDIDNDGFVDLYITQLGSNVLLRNLGNGRFEDITAKAGVDDDRWSTSAVFLDFDRDGFLDLYVTNYVHFDPKNEPKCYTPDSARDYCGPQAYRAVGDRLFRNNGKGRFQNATPLLQSPFPAGPGLGVIAGDFNQDGWPDIVVANDGAMNFYWLSKGRGKYLEDGMFGGLAVNGMGSPEASMGIAVGDFDNDADEDLFMTHLDGETNTLYANMGKGLFEDRTNRFRLGAVSQPFTGFGTVWLDFENDGWLDLICLNGAVRKEMESQNSVLPLQQRNQLFANKDGKYFKEMSEQAGEPLKRIEVSRGVAAGDLDNDGDTDLVLTNNSGKARVLLNQTPKQATWLGLDLKAVNGKTPATGTVVTLHFKSGMKRRFTVRTDGSFLSAHDPRLTIGLGKEVLSGIDLLWPDGSSQRLNPLKINRYHTIVKK